MQLYCIEENYFFNIFIPCLLSQFYFSFCFFPILSLSCIHFLPFLFTAVPSLVLVGVHFLWDMSLHHGEVGFRRFEVTPCLRLQSSVSPVRLPGLTDPSRREHIFLRNIRIRFIRDVASYPRTKEPATTPIKKTSELLISLPRPSSVSLMLKQFRHPVFAFSLPFRISINFLVSTIFLYHTISLIRPVVIRLPFLHLIVIKHCNTLS